MLCIFAAVKEELSLLLSAFSFKQVSLGKRSIFLNKKQNLIIAKTEAGIINATHVATLIFENYPIRVAILTGCGGTFSDKGLRLGDIAIANEEIWVDANDYLLNRFPLFSFVESINYLISECIEESLIYKIGGFLTMSSTTNDEKKVFLLRKQFPQAICENMEGAAIAQMCQLYHIPFLEIRGISNFLGKFDKKDWNIELATTNVQRLLLKLLEKKKEWLG